MYFFMNNFTEDVLLYELNKSYKLHEKNSLEKRAYSRNQTRKLITRIDMCSASKSIRIHNYNCGQI